MPDPTTPNHHHHRSSSPALPERSKSKAQTTQNTPTDFSGTQFKLSKSFEFDKQQTSVEAKVLQWRKLENEDGGEQAMLEVKRRGQSGSPKPRGDTNTKNYESLLLVDHSEIEQSPAPEEQYGGGAVKFNAPVPKKRIVSDEHWMKNRGAVEKDDKFKSQTFKPRRSNKTQHIAIGATMPGKKPDAWIRRKPPPRLPSPEPEVVEPPQPKTNANEFILRYVTGTVSKGKLDRLKEAQGRPLKDNSPEDRGRTMEKFLSAMSSGEAEVVSPKQDKITTNRESGTESRSITPPRPYTSRLDSWLGATPDPFTDSPNRLRKSAKRAATFVRSEVLESSGGSTVEDRDLSHRRSSKTEDKKSRQQQHEDEQTFKDYDVNLDSPEQEPDSTGRGLRRRGATRTNASPERPKEKRRPHSSVGSELGPYDSISMRDEPLKLMAPKTSDRRDTRRQKAVSATHFGSIPEDEPSKRWRPSRELLLKDPVEKADESSEQPTEQTTSLSRKLTTHEDLMSVLSQPVTRGRTLRSACNVSKSQRRPQAGSIKDVMESFQRDEAEYSREIRTLVDGVIPVLLSCVLSRSNSAKAAGLFNARSNNTNTVTGPIVQMGVALERLKSTHRRVPLTNHNALLTWSESAQRAYEEYFKVWRLGFQDVVVNLAPASDSTAKVQKLGSGWDDGLPRNDDGYVVSGDGEKVDVASLLKRPLMRVKAIASTLSSINQLEPSESAASAVTKFQDLTAEARKRHREERARLEDEAAAEIDTTRARAPQTLAPLRDVQIDASRCVRARDYFDLTVKHSSGQKVDCRVELIIRDDHPDNGGTSGDILICEIDEKSRWLLFPPVRFSQISARSSDSPNIAVVLIRGRNAEGGEWQELMTLGSQDENIVGEWIQMIGTTPIPPEIVAHNQERRSRAGSRSEVTGSPTSTPLKMLKARNDDSHIPLGEQASEISSRWSPRQSSLSPTRPTTSSSPLSSPSAHRSSHLSAGTAPSASQEKIPLQAVPPVPANWNSRQSTVQSDFHSNPTYLSSASQSAPSTPSGTRRPPGKLRKTPPNTPDRPVRVSQTPSTLPNAQRHGERTSSSGPSKRTPPHTPTREQSFPSLGHSTTPKLSPPSGGMQLRRRSSSPLKHEYQPSDESDSSSINNTFLSDDDDDDGRSVSSESSADDTIGPLPPLSNFKQRSPRKAPPSAYFNNSKQNTLSPSQSASQGPYRSVPPGGSGSKQIASIFSWSEKGLWEILHPNECSIVVSPGLIEAFELTAEHSKDLNDPNRPRPLIALELTPLVPLRKGTAIDITIRSPPTANSIIRRGNNIMFRSRNNQECDELYNLINQARINNPTYIALQTARGPEGGWGSYMDRRAQERADERVSSWWRFGSRKGSYRAKSTRRTLSVSGQTESSVGTVSSTMSALRRLSGGSRLFDVAKSTIMPRRSSKGTSSLNTSSSGSGEIGSPRLSSEAPGPVGIRSTKIRFYQREGLGKWRDMGAARLAIMHPEKPAQQPHSMHLPPHRRALSESATSAHLSGLRTDSPVRAPGSKSEKRILVTGKTAGETLLDVTLSETAFERVARTGIAISVWEHAGMVGNTGGVTTATMHVYMVQMRSEAEAAYTFSLVGRLRY